MIQFPEFLAAIKALPLKKQPEEVKGNERILTDWFVTGGVSGGSCYMEAGDELSTWESDEPEPNFDDLDLVLKSLVPQLGDYDKEKIFFTLIDRDSTSESIGWYGNAENSSMKFVDLWKLYNFLWERGLLPPGS